MVALITVVSVWIVEYKRRRNFESEVSRPVQFLSAVAKAHIFVICTISYEGEINAVEMLQLLKDEEKTYFMENTDRIIFYPYKIGRGLAFNGSEPLVKFDGVHRSFILMRSGATKLEKKQ